MNFYSDTRLIAVHLAGFQLDYTGVVLVCDAVECIQYSLDDIVDIRLCAGADWPVSIASRLALVALLGMGMICVMQTLTNCSSGS